MYENDDVKNTLEEGKDSLHDSMDVMKEKAMNFTDMMSSCAAEKPMKFWGSALVAGMAIGCLLSKKK